MKKFYKSLSEKDKRRYAAIEAQKLGWGGISYVMQLLGCSRNTIIKGLEDLEKMDEQTLNSSRIRKKGGGRKSILSTQIGIDAAFLEVLKNHTAGDPMNELIKWTNLTHKEIASGLRAAGFTISLPLVAKLLKKHGYVKRKAQKKQTIGINENRDAQFKNIARLDTEYREASNPILRFDTKKKEVLGNLYRPGTLYTKEPVTTLDHDFWSLGHGKVIPHGIYDSQQNRGYITLGNSKDTSEFACESLKKWWNNHGKATYPNANSILAKCDGGGSNNANHYIFKEDLQKLVNEIGIEIRIAHYPPYTSKYNPIEHRLFPHITRSCQGVIFTSLELVKALVEKTQTKTGLSVAVNILNKVYKTGRKVADNFKNTMQIVFDEYLPKWNYRAVPQPE
ncbi:ISAzo13 family transposase [Microcoleus sp. SVA1_B6]